MHLHKATAKLALLLALLAIAFAASDNGQQSTIKHNKRIRSGFRLRLYQESQEAYKPRVRRRLRESRFAARNPVRRRNHLLANCRLDAFLRAERQTPSIRRQESHGLGKGFRARWLAGHGDRQDRFSTSQLGSLKLRRRMI